MLFDTHCHLDFDSFDADRDDVLARAAEADVRLMVTIGTDVPSSRRSAELARQYADQGVYAAVGIHPNSTGEVDDEAMDAVAALVAHPRTVAVGETGLDFYRDRAPRDVQERFFRRHLDLAREHDLPVIIHTRASLDQTLDVLEEEAARSPIRGVLHCFPGEVADMRRTVALGLLLGFGGPLTYPKNDTLRDVFAQTPEAHLLLETDAPFLPPQIRRGKRNEPALIAAVAERAAEVRGLSPAALSAVTTANARRLFGLTPPDSGADQ